VTRDDRLSWLVLRLSDQLTQPPADDAVDLFREEVIAISVLVVAAVR